MEPTRIALVQMCVDDRLDHTKVRARVTEKMRDIYLSADKVFLLNEVGGNFGQNFRNTLELFQDSGAEVVFCAVLHHDDCLAHKAGHRIPIEQTVASLSHYLVQRSATCPVYTGEIRTADSSVRWSTGESLREKAA
jgi:hypothetical protein